MSNQSRFRGVNHAKNRSGKESAARVLALFGAVLFAGLLAVIYDPTAIAREVSGVVTGVDPTQGKRSRGAASFSVKLDAGTTVIARADGQEFRNAWRAVLSEQTTAWFGRKRYIFLRYLGPADG